MSKTNAPTVSIARELGKDTLFLIPETGEKWVTNEYKTGLGWKKITTCRNAPVPPENPENYLGTSVLGPPDNIGRKRRWISKQFTLYHWNPRHKSWILVGPKADWVRFYGKFDRTSRRVQRQWAVYVENGVRTYKFIGDSIPKGGNGKRRRGRPGKSPEIEIPGQMRTARFISPDKFVLRPLQSAK